MLVIGCETQARCKKWEILKVRANIPHANGQPHSGVRTFSELSNDLILVLTEHVSEIDRVEASRPIALSPLARGTRFYKPPRPRTQREPG